MITLFHGLAAFRVSRSFQELQNDVTAMLCGQELCTADKPLGPYGLIVYGDCRKLWATDMWSRLDAVCRRVSSINSNIVPLIVPTSQEDVRTFARKAGNWRINHEETEGYCEGWLTPSLIRAVWWKRIIPFSVRRICVRLARTLNVPIIRVTSDSHIWDVYSELPPRLPLWQREWIKNPHIRRKIAATKLYAVYATGNPVHKLEIYTYRDAALSLIQAEHDTTTINRYVKKLAMCDGSDTAVDMIVSTILEYSDIPLAVKPVSLLPTPA